MSMISSVLALLFIFRLWNKSNKNIADAMLFLLETVLLILFLPIGKVWRARKQDDKQVYIDAAEKLRQQHLKDHPDYKYRPCRKQKNKPKNLAMQYPFNHTGEL